MGNKKAQENQIESFIVITFILKKIELRPKLNFAQKET